MLEIDVVLDEDYDEETESFVPKTSYRVSLEHSLVSLSKWESLWEVPFLGKETKTHQQTLSYIEMMILDDKVPPGVFQKLVERHLPAVNDYIGAKHTATTVPPGPSTARSQETITSELIYYWMISLNIPVQFENWHLGRLLTLIRVVNFKNDPKTTKMSQKDRRALNRARLSKHNTRG
jgi:hypothetical protein